MLETVRRAWVAAEMGNGKVQITDSKKLIGDCQSEIANGKSQTVDGELPMGKAAWTGEKGGDDVPSEAGN